MCTNLAIVEFISVNIKYIFKINVVHNKMYMFSKLLNMNLNNLNVDFT
jgi:hypothetical protein